VHCTAGRLLRLLFSWSEAISAIKLWILFGCGRCPNNMMPMACNVLSSLLERFQVIVESTHHAEGRVDPKVDEGQNGFRFWMPQSM
jgi:hypothetical protein